MKKFIQDILKSDFGDRYTHIYNQSLLLTHRTKTHMKAALNEYIDNKSGGMEMLKNRYKNAIEDIITINELQDGVNRLNENDINAVIADIDVYYRLEMNLPADIR